MAQRGVRFVLELWNLRFIPDNSSHPVTSGWINNVFRLICWPAIIWELSRSFPGSGNMPKKEVIKPVSKCVEVCHLLIHVFLTVIDFGTPPFCIVQFSFLSGLLKKCTTYHSGSILATGAPAPACAESRRGQSTSLNKKRIPPILRSHPSKRSREVFTPH